MPERDFYDVEGVLLDLGPGDVHTPSADETDAPVWIQIAKSGTFAGHPAGPFALNTGVFSEIIANFRSTENRRVAIDYEHASEQDATSGTIPLTGAPAQGWIIDLRIDGGNLWGLVEWLPQARDQIRAGAYKYLSPAIRFGTKDRVTGQPAGARLSSAALTNMPFLDGMEPLAAKDTPSVDVAIQLRDQAASIMTLTARLRDADERRAKAEGLVTQLHDRATSAEAEATALSARITRMDAAEEERIVGERFLTYRDDRGMAKESMLALYRANRDVFEKEYPEISPEHRHLLSRLVPDEQRPRAPDGRSLADIVSAIMADGHPYQEALTLASQRV